MSESANPFAPPQAEVRDVATGPTLGGRGTRLVAAIVDGLLQGAVFWGVAKLLPINLFAADAGFAGLAVTVVLGMAIFLVLQGWLLVRDGQTIGKKLLGLRIVRSDGSRASGVRLIVQRYGVSFVIAMIPAVGALYSLVDSLLIFRESRKCLHDNIADTIVVTA
jgi:uncharacterized RDD family membrane protein YckC